MIDEASVGGGQHHVLWLAKGLARDQFEVAVACAETGYLVDALRAAGIRHFPVEMDNRIRLSSFVQMQRVMRAFAPDVVHTHGGTAGFYGRIAARLLRRKAAHTYHGIHYLHFRTFWKKRLYLMLDRWLLRWTDATIFVAKSDRQLASAYGLAREERSFVIANGIEAGHFKAKGYPGRTTGRKRENIVVIGTVGRLHEQKGFTYLLDAAVELIHLIPDFEIRIIGDGELRPQLESKARGLGVQAKIRFLGTRTDIPAQLSQMDVFVLPSLWEGLPFVLLEAMCAGIPIVATEVDGVAEILEDERDALLVPAGDSHFLSMAIAETVRDKKSARMRVRNALRKIAVEFDLVKMIHRTERVYRLLYQSEPA
ncbi:MAG TPA: glycosyltransferase family 4 protein [Bacteroidota bacterium]